METFRKLGLVIPACNYTNCEYHENKLLCLAPKDLPILYRALYGTELKEEKTAQTHDGFTVMITDESAKRYYMFRCMKSVSEEEQLELKMEAQEWVNSVKKSQSVDEDSFTGHIDGIHELPKKSGQRVKNPNFWHLNTVPYYIPYDYKLPTLRQAAGLCLIYDCEIQLGKHFVHGHGN